MKATGMIFLFCLLSKAFSAPVDINVAKKSGPRVSTKEILNLEQQLKARAGEDKKFYPSEINHKNVPPPKQIDGLEDKTKTPEPDNQQPISVDMQEKELEYENEKENEEAVDEQLSELASRMNPEQVQALTEQLNHVPKQLAELPERLDRIPEQFDDAAIPGQFDLAQQDELEAAEKRHEHIDPEQLQKNEVDPSTLKEVGQEEPEGMDDEEAVQEEEMESNDQVEPEQEEAMFMQRVIEALRDRPELLQQFLQAGRLNENIPIDTRAQTPEDDADRAAVIRAEYLEATGANGGRQWDQLGNSYMPDDLLTREEDLLRPMQRGRMQELEDEVPTDLEEVNEARRQAEDDMARQRYNAMEEYQQYRGDKGARVVKKGYNVIRPEYNEHLPEYNIVDPMGRSSSDEDEMMSHQTRLNSLKGSSASSSDGADDSREKSEQSNDSESSQDSSDEELIRKRSDLQQHIMM